MSRITKSDLGSQAATAALDRAEGGRFSRIIRLTLPTGGQADRATIATGTVLDTRFLNRDADALAPDAVEAASFAASGGHLVLSLPVARQIRYLRLKTPVDGDRISAYRFDGQAVSEDPVRSATHGSSGARLDVTDAALILKRKNGSEVALSEAEIDAVTLRYAPLNPRLALRLPGETGPGIPFPVQTDADGLPVFPADGTHGGDLAAALQALLARLPAPLPDPLEIDLILSADQPCAARIDALDLSLVLETAALPEKAVLRFSGQRQDRQSLPLSLPDGALLAGGTLSVTVSGMGPRQQRQDAPATPLPAITGEGLRVADASPVATRIDMAGAQVIMGGDLMLAAPHGPVELRAMLYSDRDGLPGDALAESDKREASRASPTATAFTFPATPVPAGPVWLGVVAVSGVAVAMLGGTGRIARRDGPAFVIVEDDQTRGLSAVLRPVSPALVSGTPGGPVLTLDDLPLATLPTAGSTSLDLATAVPALGGTPRLNVTSSAKAIVTIDPPILRYGLP
ncbi:hypothetical protein [Pukyongiella litopenaei]|uniref:Uncharacterized protein n=1 Tax=Pukyongiella litopenaei TaxID=2605946 RepID=A0A2S0MKE3_9RHOB|nr:hypothetical protein [Pukyongiella litopenaei]AVO36358.1 hypothetical protein C6Y53_00615 [Pukyongiella litopenaei]